MSSRKSIFLVIVLVLIVFALSGVIFFVYQNSLKEINQSGDLFKTELSEKNKKIVVVALGDSLTKAANPSKNLLGDQPNYSYATGNKISSFTKFLENEGKEIEAYNIALSGEKSEGVLKEQVPQARSYNPDYVLLTVGGNDAFKGIEIEEFKKNLREIFQAFPEAKILIGNIPNLREFRQASYPSCQAPFIETDISLDALMEVYIIGFNQVISNIASEFNNVKVVDLFNLLNRGDVSEVDCLHFSVSGQEKAAQGFFEKK